MEMDDESDTWSMEKSNNALNPEPAGGGTNDGLSPLTSGPTGGGTNDGLSPLTSGPTGGGTNDGLSPLTGGPTGGGTNDGLSPLTGGPPGTTDTLPSGPPGTNAALRVESNITGNSTYPVYCATCNNDIYSGGGDLQSMILAGHNRERAAVGVPPLVWNDSLAAAQTWVDHMAAIGKLYHDPDPHPGGESIAARGHCVYILNPDGSCSQVTSVPAAQMQEGWFSEMNNYHGQLIGSENFHLIGHYTAAVWGRTTSIGCATASNGSGDFLVCRYYPPGNYFGQKPY